VKPHAAFYSSFTSKAAVDNPLTPAPIINTLEDKP